MVEGGVARKEALARAMLSLEGLSCGDGFGECFFGVGRSEAERRVVERELPAAPWAVTDDTLMAISVMETLHRFGAVRQEELAAHFAGLYDATRGYSRGTGELLQRLRHGAAWRAEAGALFGGEGSRGNGAAMRVAPLGAFFADDVARACAEAERSAETTHTHSEGIAGAIAVAAAAALACRGSRQDGAAFLEEVRAWVPAGAVREGLERAIGLGAQATVREAVAMLGNGARGTAGDTVPFALWSASRGLARYEDALWRTVSAGGDRDTTCAIVGGIVVLAAGETPAEWRRRREAIAPFFGRGEGPEEGSATGGGGPGR